MTAELNLKMIFVAVEQYHGGTNFGRTSGGPFISTSYDYDAPLDEYGMFPLSLDGLSLHLHMFKCILHRLYHDVRPFHSLILTHS